MRRFLTVLLALCAAPALASTGCEDSEPSAGDVALGLCEYEEACYPADFAAEYASMQECTAERVAWMDDLRQEYGPGCYTAALAYGDCVGSQSCTVNPEAACAAELTRADDACEEPAPDSPCPGYVSGTDDDYCCQTDDPCDWASDAECDCGGACVWDVGDCG